MVGTALDFALAYVDGYSLIFWPPWWSHGNFTIVLSKPDS